MEKNQNVINKFSYKSYNTYTKTKNAYDPNKYKYVKPETPVILPEKIPTKVIINPNLKQKIHINPNFKPKPDIKPVTSNSVHINPKIINVSLIKSRALAKSNTSSATVKVVRPQNYINNVKIIKTPVRKRRISIRSRYKIVKSDKIQTPTSKTIIKNRFKIDRRSKTKMKYKKKIVTSINDSIRTCLFKNKTWSQSSIKIDKSTSNPIKSIKTKQENAKNRRSLITLRGKKYTTGLNKKSLKIISNSKSSLMGKKMLLKNGNKSRKSSLSQGKSGSTSNLRL